MHHMGIFSLINNMGKCKTLFYTNTLHPLQTIKYHKFTVSLENKHSAQITQEM